MRTRPEKSASNQEERAFAVDGDDAEVLGADGLDARGQEAAGFAEVLTPVGAAAPGSRAGLHGWVLRKRPWVYLPSTWRPTGGRRREEFFSLKELCQIPAFNATVRLFGR
jgi:hypothetical protein